MRAHAKETRAAVNFESRSQNASWVSLRRKIIEPQGEAAVRLAQPAERKALNLVVVGSSPTVGDSLTNVQFCRARQAKCCGRTGI